MINENKPTDFLSFHIGIKKIPNQWGIKEAFKYLGHALVDNFITRLPAHIYIYMQASKIIREPTGEAKKNYVQLKGAYHADKNLKALEKKLFQDNIFTTARLALLDLALSMEQTKNNSENQGRGLKVTQAELLLECMEWTVKDSGAESYKNIQRIYRGSHNIIDQSNNVIDEETAKSYQSKFAEMYAEMHEAFYEFRKEVVAHQNSLWRAAGGLLNDKKVNSSHEKVMTIFRRFTDTQNHPENVEMLKTLIPSQDDSNVQEQAK